MPRRLTLPLPPPVPGLERRYPAERGPVARSHWSIVWLLARAGISAHADVTGYLVTWARDLARRYHSCSPLALGDRRHGVPGRRY